MPDWKAGLVAPLFHPTTDSGKLPPHILRPGISYSQSNMTLPASHILEQASQDSDILGFLALYKTS